jgi:hypothetical protein
MSDYISYLPHLNACLNGTSALLLFSGYRFIRARNVAAHRACQTYGAHVSILFLASYLTYHYNHGTTRFQGTGLARPIYFTILTSHTILAIVIVPLVALTLLPRATPGLRAPPSHRTDHTAALALRVDHRRDRLSYALPDLSFLNYSPMTESKRIPGSKPILFLAILFVARHFWPGISHGLVASCPTLTSRSTSQTRRTRATYNMRSCRFNSASSEAIPAQRTGIRR